MKKIILVLSIFAIAVSFDSCKKSSTAPDPTPTPQAPIDTTGNNDTTGVADTTAINILLATPQTTLASVLNYDTSNVRVFLKTSTSLTRIQITPTQIDAVGRNIRFESKCNMSTTDSLVIVFDALFYKSSNGLVAKATVGSNTHNIYNYVQGTFLGNYNISNSPTFGGGLQGWTTGTYQRVAYIK